MTQEMTDADFRHYVLTKIEGYVQDLHRRIDFMDDEILSLGNHLKTMLHRLGGYRADDDVRSEED